MARNTATWRSGSGGPSRPGAKEGGMGRSSFVTTGHEGQLARPTEHAALDQVQRQDSNEGRETVDWSEYKPPVHGRQHDKVKPRR